MLQGIGPLIKIIISMFSDFFQLSFVYFVLLAIFSSIGFFLFSSLDEFDTVINVMRLLFNTTQGNFDFSIFDKLE